MHECIVEAGVQPQRNPQHRAYLGGTQRRADTVAGRIAHQQHKAHVVEFHEVVKVAAGLVGRRERTRKFVAIDFRHRFRQRANLHVARNAYFSIEFFGFDDLLGNPCPMQHDGCLCGECDCDKFILIVKLTIVLVENLQHADQRILIGRSTGS